MEAKVITEVLQWLGCEVVNVQSDPFGHGNEYHCNTSAILQKEYPEWTGWVLLPQYWGAQLVSVKGNKATLLRVSSQKYSSSDIFAEKDLLKN